MCLAGPAAHFQYQQLINDTITAKAQQLAIKKGTAFLCKGHSLSGSATSIILYVVEFKSILLMLKESDDRL